jgi:hypothetical protein
MDHQRHSRISEDANGKFSPSSQSQKTSHEKEIVQISKGKHPMFNESNAPDSDQVLVCGMCTRARSLNVPCKD